MSVNDDDRPAPWSRLRQDVGAVVWSSFLAACLATMLFFAAFDPLLLANDDAPPWWLESRMTGYGIGFFSLGAGWFWARWAHARVAAPQAMTSRPRKLSI